MWKITLGNQLHRGTMHILDRAQMLTLLVSDGPRTENLRNLLNFINPSWALILSIGTPWWICISAWFMLLQRAENPKDLYVPCNRPQSISVLGWCKSALASPLGNSASWGHTTGRWLSPFISTWLFHFQSWAVCRQLCVPPSPPKCPISKPTPSTSRGSHAFLSGCLYIPMYFTWWTFLPASLFKKARNFLPLLPDNIFFSKVNHKCTHST